MVWKAKRQEKETLTLTLTLEQSGCYCVDDKVGRGRNVIVTNVVQVFF